MPRPTSRRSSAGRRPQPEPEQPVDDIEVVDPPAPATEDEYAPVEQDAAEAPAEPVAEAPSASRRGRAAGRSSRRAAPSGRASARVSSRRELTPEQKAARKAAMATAVKTVGGVVVGLGLAFAAWWFLVRTDERTSLAQQQLTEVRSLMQHIESSIVTAKDPAAAEASRVKASEILEKSAELGYARETPDPNNARLADPRLAREAFELKAQLEKEVKERVERAERDRLVAVNEQTMKSGLANLGTMTDAQLANFEKDFAQYIENPVVPTAGANEQFKKDYMAQITGVRVQGKRIEDEKRRRAEAITDIPVRDASGKAMVLVQQEKFKEALALIDDLQRTYDTADFKKVRQFVLDAAEGTWAAASSMADENYKTYRAPGTTKETARLSLQAARDRMQQIIDRFGIDDYVGKAKAKLAGFVE